MLLLLFLMVLKYLFANATATVINGPVVLVNNAPKNPLIEIILDIFVLDNFISVDVLFSNGFLSLVFCLIVNNNS